MLPNDLRFCAADVLVNSDNFETGIFTDTKTGTVFDGWRDHSGFNNHLVVRSGTVTHEVRSGIEGAVFDGVLLATMRQYLMMGAGTLAMCFSGGVKLNTGRHNLTIEAFDATTTRTGNAGWQLSRYNNFADWGAPGQSTRVTLPGSVDDTIHRTALAVDQKSARKGIYGKFEGSAVSSHTPSENASVSPRGADLVFGRIDQNVTDAARVALTGDERLWLSHVQMWGNFQEGNLISDYPSELEGLFQKMAAAR